MLCVLLFYQRGRVDSKASVQRFKIKTITRFCYCEILLVSEMQNRCIIVRREMFQNCNMLIFMNVTMRF